MRPGALGAVSGQSGTRLSGARQRAQPEARLRPTCYAGAALPDAMPGPQREERRCCGEAIERGDERRSSGDGASTSTSGASRVEVLAWTPLQSPSARAARQRAALAAAQGNPDAETMWRRSKAFRELGHEAARVAWMRRAAEAGLAEAQCHLAAELSQQGDDRGAAEWCRRAAERGLARAQHALGLFCSMGQGVDRNHEAAARWYRLAAEQGHSVAQRILGQCHDEGRGVHRSAEEAATWYSRAAEQGDAAAQRVLAARLFNGEGVARDGRAAEAWARRAVFEHGDYVAMYYLSQMEGVLSDAERLDWMRQAAEAAAQDDDAANTALFQARLAKMQGEAAAGAVSAAASEAIKRTLREETGSCAARRTLDVLRLTRQCDACDATPSAAAVDRLRCCGFCGEAFYCSRECQAAHWPQHKSQCRGFDPAA